MKNKLEKFDIVGLETLNKKAFDDYRNGTILEFESSSIFLKRKMTQAAFWTALDKDLADQLFRDERWIFGIKYKDEIKTIDHGAEKDREKKLGF